MKLSIIYVFCTHIYSSPLPTFLHSSPLHFPVQSLPLHPLCTAHLFTSRPQLTIAPPIPQLSFAHLFTVYLSILLSSLGAWGSGFEPSYSSPNLCARCCHLQMCAQIWLQLVIRFLYFLTIGKTKMTYTIQIVIH